MRKRSTLAGAIAVAAAACGLPAEARHQAPAGGALYDLPAGRGQVVRPRASLERPKDVGHRAHVNVKYFVPVTGLGSITPGGTGAPVAGYYFETPASLACVYGLAAGPAGCNPSAATQNATTGSRAIAIVDAYHYATARTDLTLFSQQFGLPAPTKTSFQVVYANGTQPAVNSDWNLEEALDIEWAHAMAPKAKIYLVEAASNNFSDLQVAVAQANRLLAQGPAPGGEVSMSWGGSEFPGETSYDAAFTQSGVVYFASAGDDPGVIWPSASPNVVSVGGTTLSRDPASGDFQGELAWQSTGGGPSVYEPRPSGQGRIGLISGGRGTPDVSAIADPTTGVWVYLAGTWWIVGGTSLASPVWAGIVNSEGRFSASSAAEQALDYGQIGNPGWFTDITSGSCGPNGGFLAAAGWDFCTGGGSPRFNRAQ